MRNYHLIAFPLQGGPPPTPTEILRDLTELTGKAVEEAETDVFGAVSVSALKALLDGPGGTDDIRALQDDPFADLPMEDFDERCP